MLLNLLDSDLYERQGKAISNFSKTLPEESSDLAQEITKDPYQAQYALESSSQPIAISEYELEKFYPEKVEGVSPSIYT